MKLKDICKYGNKKIGIEEISSSNYISTENLLPNFKGYFDASNLPNATKVTAFEVNNILISNIRPYFKKMIFSEQCGGCSNDILVLEVFNKEVLPKYLYYSLLCDKFFNYMTITSKGTKMPRGDKNAIMDYEVNIPSIETQSKVVDLLSTLDNKIELNNQINNNLCYIT